MNTTNREQPNLDFLLQKLNHSDPDTQEEAALEIAKIGQNNQVLSSALLNHLQTNNPSFKGAIIYSLGELGSNEAIPALMELLDSSDEEIRWATVEALEKIGSNEIVPKIIACLEKESVPDIRGALVRTLGNFYTEETLLTLYKYAECDDDTFVRRSASKSLQKIARAYGITDTTGEKVWFYVRERLDSLVSGVAEELRNAWEPVYSPKGGAVAMGFAIPMVGAFAGNQLMFRGFKKHLTIEGEPYELTIRCRDRATNTWDFFLEPSHPWQSIPEGYQLRLLTESLEIFAEEETEEDEKILSIENLQLQSGQQLIWETEPKPDDYQPEVLCF
jgi:hypothetical protein